MKLQSSAPKRKKRADVNRRIERLTLTAETDAEEIFLAWLRVQISWATLWNMHVFSHRAIERADEEPAGPIVARTVNEAYRLAPTPTEPPSEEEAA